MRRLRSEHVVQAKVGNIEEAEDWLPAQVHGHQLAPHNISKVLDHTHGVQLACMVHQHFTSVTRTSIPQD